MTKNSKRLVTCVITLVFLVAAFAEAVISVFSYPFLFSFASQARKQRRIDVKQKRDKYEAISYKMQPSKLVEFVRKMSEVKLGDARQDVVGKLGAPNIEKVMSPKEPWLPVRGRFLKYYVQVKDIEQVDEKSDKLVVLTFNSKDNLVRVESNVAGIPNQP